MERTLLNLSFGEQGKSLLIGGSELLSVIELERIEVIFLVEFGAISNSR